MVHRPALVRRCCTLLAGASALILAACTSPADLPLEERAEGCPETAIVSGAESVTLFRDAGSTDLSEIVLRGSLLEFSGECEYKDDRVTIDLAVVVAGERGPAIGSDEVAGVDYFVAILNPQGEIETQEVFRADFSFDDRRTRLSSREDLELMIPLENARSGASYSILLGFQLTRAQREFNRNS